MTNGCVVGLSLWAIKRQWTELKSHKDNKIDVVTTPWLPWVMEWSRTCNLIVSWLIVRKMYTERNNLYINMTLSSHRLEWMYAKILCYSSNDFRDNNLVNYGIFSDLWWTTHMQLILLFVVYIWDFVSLWKFKI